MSLLPESSVQNPEADKKWTRAELDRLLEMYFSGQPPDRIAIQLKRNPKAVRRWLEMLSYNERDHAVRYQPVQRTSRQGKRMTQNEHVLIRCHAEREIDPEHTARLLQRKVREFCSDIKAKAQVRDMRKLSVGVDLVLAYRFLYYVHGISMVPDRVYDELEQEEIEYGGGAGILNEQVGSDNAADYPPHIRSLALYLAFKYAERKKDVAGS